MAWSSNRSALSGSLFLLGLFLAVAEATKRPLTSIKNSDLSSFDEVVATKEVQKDIENFIRAFSKAKKDLKYIAQKFKDTRVKDVGIRKIADWGIALSRLYELGAATEQDSEAILAGMQEVSELLLEVQSDMHGYVENKLMRGWPMYVSEDDARPIFESFNFGHIGMAISLTARALALKGKHIAAARMVSPVLDALYDGFLTDDLAKTKLDRQGRVVYVPAGAPAGRKRRHIEVAEQDGCLDNPQAYNHGIMAARAAIATWRAISEIDWSKARWPMLELDLKQAKSKLNRLVLANARYLKEGLEKQRPTGSSKYDKYPGPDGQTWVQWKYRNYDKCPKEQGTHRDRPEDMAHATYETNFVAEVRTWMTEHTSKSFKEKNRDVFTTADAHSMMVTFLNRVVADYDAKGRKRFACDVHGTNDISGRYKDKGNHAWKQCSGSRARNVRSAFAPSWLPLAASVRNTRRGNSQVHCDALRMVEVVLPLAMSGDKKYDEENFDRMTVKSGSEIIEAKYHWHYFRKGVSEVCSAATSRSAGPRKKGARVSRVNRKRPTGREQAL